MKLTRTNLWLAAAAAMLLTASCSQAPDAAEAEKDPSADAAYKRAHRAEGYREAQRSKLGRLMPASRSRSSRSAHVRR